MEIGIRQHALLYALICRYCFLNAEEEAEELIEEITTAYGRRRGERMHRLAAENKEDADMNSFLVHSEWQGKEGENISVMSFEKDRTVCEVTKCACAMPGGNMVCRNTDRTTADISIRRSAKVLTEALI